MWIQVTADDSRGSKFYLNLDHATQIYVAGSANKTFIRMSGEKEPVAVQEMPEELIQRWRDERAYRT